VAYALRLATRLRKEGWKVKIRDKERLEPPHVTILHRGGLWRLGLRDGEFLPPGGSWNDIDEAVKTTIELHWEELCRTWDEMYPTNPIAEEENDDQ
jgi:hypothetical protein